MSVHTVNTVLLSSSIFYCAFNALTLSSVHQEKHLACKIMSVVVLVVVAAAAAVLIIIMCPFLK